MRRAAYAAAPKGKLSPMSGQSAGVLMYRRRGRRIEVLLVHPGGPYWRNKDTAA